MPRLTTGDIVELVKRRSTCRSAGRARGEQGLRRRRVADPARRDRARPRRVRALGNRRLRTVGELIQEAFRIGLYRMERVVRERLDDGGRGRDHAADDRPTSARWPPP